MENNKYYQPTTFQITNLGEDENWFKAVLHRSEGYIPKNYVRFSIPRLAKLWRPELGQSQNCWVSIQGTKFNANLSLF